MGKLFGESGSRLVVGVPPVGLDKKPVDTKPELAREDQRDQFIENSKQLNKQPQDFDPDQGDPRYSKLVYAGWEVPCDSALLFESGSEWSNARLILGLPQLDKEDKDAKAAK